MRSLDSKPDVVIVGAGIAGSALAISLAGSGYGLTLLEKSTVHVDRVRGEFIVPWGVAEAKTLGILDVLESVGGNYTVRSIPYGEEFSPEDARKYPFPMDQMVPGVRGAMNLGHPRICNALNAAAMAAGATLLRGVDRIQVSAGLPPRIEFTHSGLNYTLSPRIVIGADGRGSTVARQVGFERLADPIHHILSGLLVDDVSAWPHDEQSIGVDGDVGFYIFPQGNGRVRLYATHGLDQRNRFAGDGATERFLQAFDRSSIPHAPETFVPYASRRREQMRRLRFSSRLLSTYRMEFTDEARQRRRMGRRRMVADPELTLWFMALQKGPFAVPSEAFSERIWDRLLD